MKKFCSKGKGSVFAAALIMTVGARAAGWQSIESFNSFFVRLQTSENVYYVVSPKAVKFRREGGDQIFLPLKEARIEEGYVAFYRADEAMEKNKIVLAQRNIEVIRDFLLEGMRVSGHNSMKFGFDGPPIKARAFFMHLCQFDIAGKIHEQAGTLIYGRKISSAQFCAGYGLLAAMYGYEILVEDKKLVVRRVISGERQ